MTLLRNRSKGMTMFELIAAMVLVAILTPTMSYIISYSMRSIAATRIGLDADEDAEYALRSFTLHIDRIVEFMDDSILDTTLAFKAQVSSTDTVKYIYSISDQNRWISCTREDGPEGILLEEVIGDSIDSGDGTTSYLSRFIYRNKNGSVLTTPKNSTIHSVELVIFLDRGSELYRYTTSAVPGRNLFKL